MNVMLYRKKLGSKNIVDGWFIIFRNLNILFQICTVTL